MRWRGLCALLACLATCLVCQSPAVAATTTATKTPIKHFITLMQENHSYDNYFGTYPRGDGLPEGVCQLRSGTDPAKGCVEPFAIGNGPVRDIGHSKQVHAHQYNNGAMDGFVSAFEGSSMPELSMGYYDDKQIPYYWNVADHYVLFDRAFTSAAGGSVWNHFYWVTGGPGNEIGDSLLPGGIDVPTIFDRLEAADISWKFYVQNYRAEINFRNPGEGDVSSQLVWVPILNIPRFVDNPELAKHIVPLDEYYVDLENGTLPAVSYIVPSGTSEHPPGSVQAGTRFVRSLIDSLMLSSAWESSAFMWTYDDWGGWYDHVPPPQLDAFGYGFRAPTLMVSPYARPGHLDSTIIDFTSQLKFIEYNWGLASLSSRDQNANNILTAFDFESPPRVPVLLGEQRGEQTQPRVPSGRVYSVYGGSALLLVVLLSLAGFRTRRLGVA